MLLSPAGGLGNHHALTAVFLAAHQCNGQALQGFFGGNVTSVVKHRHMGRLGKRLLHYTAKRSQLIIVRDDEEYLHG